jgi:hypothetical protein
MGCGNPAGICRATFFFEMWLVCAVLENTVSRLNARKAKTCFMFYVFFENYGKVLKLSNIGTF